MRTGLKRLLNKIILIFRIVTQLSHSAGNMSPSLACWVDMITKSIPIYDHTNIKNNKNPNSFIKKDYTINVNMSKILFTNVIRFFCKKIQNK